MIGPQSNFEMVQDFNRVMEVEKSWTRENLGLRLKLIEEEFNEVFDEFYDKEGDIKNERAINKRQVAKEFADLLYVIYGAADCLGIPLDTAFREVHRSNMSKFGPDGKAIRREDGKVLKGPNYSPADMSILRI